MNNKGINCGLTGMIERFVEYLTPNNCFICNAIGGLLCEACQESEIEPSFRVCYACSARSDYYSTCKSCRKRSIKPLAVYHVANYDSHAKKLIYMMKFSSTREAARIIATMINDVLPDIEVDAIVPTPTSRARIRQRSFDHAVLIAKHLAVIRKQKMKKLLKRKGKSRQLGASKQMRYRQAALSLLVRKNAEIPNKILLIDDVVSSGATLETATRLLKKAGAKEVYVAVFARKA